MRPWRVNLPNDVMLRLKHSIFSNMRILLLISSILVFNCMQYNKHTINYSRQNVGYFFNLLLQLSFQFSEQVSHLFQNNLRRIDRKTAPHKQPAGQYFVSRLYYRPNSKYESCCVHIRTIIYLHTEKLTLNCSCYTLFKGPVCTQNDLVASSTSASPVVASVRLKFSSLSVLFDSSVIHIISHVDVKWTSSGRFMKLATHILCPCVQCVRVHIVVQAAKD